MKKITLFLVSVVLLVFCFASTSFAWTLVYENDANGNTTYGNIQDLIDAVNAGKQVRFSITLIGFDGVTNTSVYEAEIVWVRNNKVYAQDTSPVGASFQGDELPFNQPAYYLFQNVSTTGVVFTSRWRVGEHTSEGESRYNFPIKWFVQ